MSPALMLTGFIVTVSIRTDSIGMDTTMRVMTAKDMIKKGTIEMALTGKDMIEKDLRQPGNGTKVVFTARTSLEFLIVGHGYLI